MQWLDYELWNNPTRQWLIAAGIAAAVVLGMFLLRVLASRRLQSRTAVDGTISGTRDVLASALGATHTLFYLIVAAYIGSKDLQIPVEVETALRLAAIVATLFQIGLWFQRAVQASVELYRSRHESSVAAGTIAAAFGFLARLIAWSIIGIMVLANFGIEVTALVAGLGIGGIAAALAVQSTLGDLFSSLSLYFDRPFDLGDFIIVDDFMGAVNRIGLRSTRIESLGGEQIIFSNSDLARSRIRNYGRMKERRVVFKLGVTYQTPADKLERVPSIIQAIIDEAENTRFERCHFREYGDYSLSFEIVYWVLTADFGEYMDRHHQVNLAIYRRFEQEGIEFAYPTRTIYYHREDEPEQARAAA